MTRRAFTLIELLIVVAIIAILAAIAVPNFLEAQVRAKVSRTKTDMRTIATGLESYRIDNNKYAPMADWRSNDPAGTDYWSSTGTAFHSRLPNFITTPVAYMTSLPEDVFIPQVSPSPFTNTRYPQSSRVGYRYTYFNYQALNSPARIDQTGGWMFYSFGPDQDGNFTSGPKLGSNSTYTRYDPTNGTISVGNVIRTQRSPEGSIPYNPAITSAQNGPN